MDCGPGSTESMTTNRPRSLFFLLIVLLGAIPLACDLERSRGVVPSYTTDIYLAPLSEEAGRLDVGLPVNLTDREGYDNQPAFLPDGSGLLLVSRREDQTDVRRHEFESGRTEWVTETPEREYQPLPLPRGDGFSAIRVERSGDQRIWRFDPAGGRPEPLVKKLADARYYTWVDDETVAVVDVDMRPNLSLLGIGSGEEKQVLDRVGRSIQRVPGRRAISFVHKTGLDEWWIKELDLDTLEIRDLVLARPGSEDHAWTPSGLLLMGQGSRLFQWRPEPGAGWDDWVEIDDLSMAGLFDITRLAVSPRGDQLAIVSRAPEKP